MWPNWPMELRGILIIRAPHFFLLSSHFRPPPTIHLLPPVGWRNLGAEKEEEQASSPTTAHIFSRFVTVILSLFQSLTSHPLHPHNRAPKAIYSNKLKQITPKIRRKKCIKMQTIKTHRIREKNYQTKEQEGPPMECKTFMNRCTVYIISYKWCGWMYYFVPRLTTGTAI